MQKRAPTRAERRHMDEVARLGCIVTVNGLRCGAPAHCHHPTGAGMALRASNFDVIPLCPYHHQDGPFGHAVHNGTKTFEANYGSQAELLVETAALLASARD